MGPHHAQCLECSPPHCMGGGPTWGWHTSLLHQVIQTLVMYCNPIRVLCFQQHKAQGPLGWLEIRAIVTLFQVTATNNKEVQHMWQWFPKALLVLVSWQLEHVMVKGKGKRVQGTMGLDLKGFHTHIWLASCNHLASALPWLYITTIFNPFSYWQNVKIIKAHHQWRVHISQWLC